MLAVRALTCWLNMSVMGPINCSTAVMRELASIRSLNTRTFEIVNMPLPHVQIRTQALFSHQAAPRFAPFLPADPLWTEFAFSQPCHEHALPPTRPHEARIY